MGRQIKIILLKAYPHTCAECPLCGVRPKEELEEGSKWTHICVWSERILSGRGIKQPKARNRCGERAYKQFYFEHGGNYYITPSRLKKYQIEQQKLQFTQ